MKKYLASADGPISPSRRQFLAHSLLLFGGVTIFNVPTIYSLLRNTPTLERTLVTIPTNTQPMRGYLVHPAGMAAWQGVVMIPDRAELDNRTLQAAERLAAEGFAVLVPDVYQNSSGTLQTEQSLIDTQWALNYLLTQNFVRSSRAAVLSFGTGAALATRMFQSGRNVGPVAILYGGDIAPDDPQLSDSAAPDIYGEAISFPQPQPAADAITPGVLVLHAFFSDTVPAARATTQAQAWERVLAWLRYYTL